jgi:hypothetical protein
MSGAYFAIGAAMAALSVVFFARGVKPAEPAARRGALIVGGLFVAAGLLFMVAGAITMFKD